MADTSRLGEMARALLARQMTHEAPPEPAWPAGLGRALIDAFRAGPTGQVMQRVGEFGMGLPGAVQQGFRGMEGAVHGDYSDPTARTRDVIDALGLVYGGSALTSAPKGALRTFGGVKARTADHRALARAQELAESGADKRAIWDETGWFQGPDGKWRFEIDDSGATYSNRYLADEQIGDQKFKEGPADVALDHDALYSAYPDLRGSRVVEYPFSSPDGQRGEYRPRAEFSFAPPIPETMTLWRDGANKSTALHEAQHAVQQAEGFASGGNPRNWSPNELPDNPRHQKWLDNQPEVQWAKEYYGSPKYQADREAQNAYYREVWEPKIEAAGFGDDADAIFAIMEPDLARRFPDMARFDRAAREFGLERPDAKIAPREAYRRLAGEVEARNVQKRRDFTPEQRRATPPWETQDVPDAEQIVRFGGGVQNSLGFPPLPMDEASRMARAREMGFDTETPLYHGTKGGEVGTFRASDGGELGPGVYVTKDPTQASEYARNSYGGGYPDGANVSPLVAKPMKEVDRQEWVKRRGEIMDELRAANGGEWDSRFVREAEQRLIDEMRADGFAGFYLKNPTGNRSFMYDQGVVFDPADIRSPYAAFDPAKADSADLLAARPFAPPPQDAKRDEIEDYLALIRANEALARQNYASTNPAMGWW